MDRVLILRATHKRRPTTIPSHDTSTVHLTLSDYTTVATNVPFWKAPRGGLIRQGEGGNALPAEFTGFVRRDHEVIVQDLFVVGADIFEVTFLGNVGVHLRTFDLAKVVVT